MLLVMTILGITCACQAAEKSSASPDVLVLILSGIGPNDSVSINYATKVSDKDVDADVKKLMKATRWPANNAEQTTETANVPGAKPTTSVNFQTMRIVASDGLLPIEPFVDVFKRFKVIRINYLMQSPFQFAGLKDFENDFVKVSFLASGNSYQYTVQIKNSSFDSAGLPMQPKTLETAQPMKGMSASMRTILIVGTALLVSVFVYFMAAYICRR
jgi:hypothetical protein